MVGAYKSLRNVTVEFTAEQKSSTAPSAQFFIGVNGSGKSSMLEAIGLIFTRIMQGETPGFDFEVVYQMPDETEVTVRPIQPGSTTQGGNEKLDVHIRKKGKAQPLLVHTIPDDYRPDRIVAYSSGANNAMEDVLMRYPKSAIANELYDRVFDSSKDETDGAYIRELVAQYDQLDENPRTLYLDAPTSKFIIPFLFAVLPMNLLAADESSARERERYHRLQRMLLDRLGFSLKPVAFSLVIDAEKMSEIASAQQEILALILDKRSDQQTVYDWISDAPFFGDRPEGEQNAAQETSVAFLYEQTSNASPLYYHKKLQNFCKGDPFPLLSALVNLHQRGIVKDIHMSFQREGCGELLQLDALSDGELMWLARMGLILMSQKHCGSNSLFLLDEPDVHFNDDWNKEFVHMLYEMSGETPHQFIIATHSPLLLTDVWPEQLYLFRKNPETGTSTVDIPTISTFAAQRERIATELFDTDPIGVFAQLNIKKLLHETDADKLLDGIGRVGPGYPRFRLYEQYYGMTAEASNEE